MIPVMLLFFCLKTQNDFLVHPAAAAPMNRGLRRDVGLLKGASGSYWKGSVVT